MKEYTLGACFTRKRSQVQVQYRPHSQKRHQFETDELTQILALVLASNPNLAKQIRLQQLDNDVLFDTYINELKFRQLSPCYITSVSDLLFKFKDYLGDRKPSPELAQTFLTRYVKGSS